MFQRLLDKLNNLSSKQLLAMAGVAAVLMFGAIYAGMTLLAESNKPIQPPPEEKVVETVAVVVAKNNIHPRTRIQESMLQIKELPADIVPEGAIKSFTDVVNVQVKVSIFAGDILTIQKVFAEGGDEGFTGSIPADCRAVSISVNDITGVAGFAKPGDRVDLLLVEKGKHRAMTELLLQNVPLLSINQDAGGGIPVDKNGVPTGAIANPSIATFALQPKEALKLISAAKIGEIYISLRPSKPQSAYVEPMEYTIESIEAPKPEPVREPAPVIPSNPAPQIPVAPVAPVEPPQPKIEIIAGDQVVQSATPTLPAGGPINPPNQPNQPTTSQPLPAIPSRGVPQEFSAPPVPHVPLADSPVVRTK